MLKRKGKRVCERITLWGEYVSIHSKLTYYDAVTIYPCLINPNAAVTAEIIELANKGCNVSEIFKILYSSYYIGFVEGRITGDASK
jgi:hypothetical protein